MSDQHELQKFIQILRRYPYFCKTCGQYNPQKNKKQHTCNHETSPNKKLLVLLSSDFINSTSSSNNGHFDRSDEAIMNNLTKIISPRFPKVRVFPFGSRVIGTGTQNSDLDIYVDLDESYHKHGLDKNVMNSVSEVEKILKSNPTVWHNIHITHAKVPIIETFNKIEGLQCDISFSDGLGHSNTQLIKKLCDNQPIFRHMIIYLGKWLDIIELSDHQHINKYSLRLLIMNYLQRKGLIPSVKDLQSNIPNPVKIGEWNVDYNETKINNLTKNNSNNLGEHIQGFFKEHSNAKRFNGIISTYLGATVQYDQMIHDNSFKNYKNFIDKYEDEKYEVTKMKVQGPFHLADNPAKQVSAAHLKKFIHFSKVSYDFLIAK